ncbi:hypothetical protein GHT06_008945 [Daphnia sinensis]|uniref:Uncharacterized protein n=1 Tax=Daphnia sinensis TaxID=1820382 RepID=A0AAD5Q2P9_9CRUS|nr:hypothetical protein GHT06_008945 [Daphnia sinensis]
MRDSFYQVIRDVACDGLVLPKIFCEDHQIRYHMEAKRLKNEVSQKLKEEQRKLHKLSEMVS